MILQLREQFGGIDGFEKIALDQNSNLIASHQFFDDKFGEKRYCFKIKQENNVWMASTSYFIGVDWICENKKAIYVKPKLNNIDTGKEINYLSMLQESISDVDNLNHLDGLFQIKTNKSSIEIMQYQDLLTPLLIIQFLQLLKAIVRKGLKKSYYPVTKNMNAKIKGKVLINKTIKSNLTKGQITNTYCQYQEFGINNAENKLLKKALNFSRSIIENNKILKLNQQIVFHTLSYIQPAFEGISDDLNESECKYFKSNPLFKEYSLALKLAQLILKRFAYNISNTNKEKILTPPFWIDMSKLFELYVFKKFRDVFRKSEVFYHEKIKRQEPDFLISSDSNNFKMVVDAKYKPYYKNTNINILDARQVAGYSRLKKIYEKLGLKDFLCQNIDCLIVYPCQEDNEEFKLEDLKKYEISDYVQFYKIGIKLPENTLSHFF